MSKNLYIVRHGQTDWNLEHRKQGRTDIKLNETGIKQAHITKEKLSGIPFDICFSSPLKRAAKTATIICEEKTPIIYDDLLVERCFGKAEGTIQNGLPNASNYTFGNKYDDNTETWENILSRAEKFLEKIKNTDAENILVVSHGVFLKALHFTIVGYDKNTDFLSWFLDNGEIEKYKI